MIDLTMYTYSMASGRCPYCGADLTAAAAVTLDGRPHRLLAGSLADPDGRFVTLDRPAELLDVLCSDCDGDLGDYITHEVPDAEGT